MAEDKEEIKIIFDTNANEASKEVNKLNDSIVGTETATAKTAKATNDLGNASKKAGQASKEQAGAMGSLDSALGGAISSMKSMLKTMWLLVANPLILTVTAIVAGLALLFKAFVSTKEGGEALDRAMAKVGAIIDIARDRFLQLAKALSDFSWEGIKKALTGIGDEIEREVKLATQATRELQKVTDAERDLSVSRSALNSELAKSEKILTDTNATYAEKLKALKEVEVAEKKQTDAELANAKRKLDAIKALNEQSDSNPEALQRAADAQIKVNELEQKSAEDRRKISEFNKTLQNEESARLKTIDDERKAMQKEIDDENKRIADEKQKVIDEAQAISDKAKEANDLIAKTDLERLTEKYQSEKALLEQSKIDTLEIESKYWNDVNELNLKQAEIEKEINEKKLAEQKAIDEAKLALDKQIQDSEIQIAEQGIGIAKEIFGKSKAVQKAGIIADSAIGVGKSIIANNAANIGALATPQAIATSGVSAVPVIALNNISTGLAVAANIAATAKALQAVGGGSAGSAPSGTSAPRGVNAEAQVGFQASNENQIATSFSRSQSQQPPLKAYVVGSDVTTQQTLDAKLVKQNSFGG